MTPRTLLTTALLAVALGGLGSARAFAQSALVERGPYLQQGTTDGVTIRWRTDVATDSRVLCGTTLGALSVCAEDLDSVTDHELTLSGLPADTLHYYAIGSTTEQLAGDDADHFFVTNPVVGTRKPIRIWVLGDSGTFGSPAGNVRDAYTSYTGTTHTDLWLMLGDNAYPNGTDAEYQSAVFDRYPEMLRKSVLWPTFGNHDGSFGSSATQSADYHDIFTLPTNAESGGVASTTEAYYSFDYANVHFVVLNSFDVSRSPGSAMLTWLEADLANTDQDWLVAYWHHPPYSKGSHDSDTEIELVQMRQFVLPILEDHGVDLVLTGHSHSYERTFMIDGHYGTSDEFAGGGFLVDAGDGSTTGDGAYEKDQIGPLGRTGTVYTVAGSSGQLTPGIFGHPAVFVHFYVMGSLVIDVDSDRMDVAFLSDTQAVLDEFTIVKGVACPVDPFLDDDGDEICNETDNCPQTANVDQLDDDEDGLGDACDPCPTDPGNDDDEDGVCFAEDSDPGNRNVCRDVDLDGCDDCTNGSDAPLNDGPDNDGDGTCDAGDPDDDNDSVADGDDSHPFDGARCRDVDLDGCDDCSTGTDAPLDDGPDNDGDGSCDVGDPDDDNDTVADGDDSHPFDSSRCRDVDTDGCDDCSTGTDAPLNDGPDNDGDGLCDTGDPDDDNDTVIDTEDGDPFDPNVCRDVDSDTCDDCAGGETVLFSAGFDSGAQGFAYADDTFRGTSRPQNASGSYLAGGGFSGGGLQVRLASNFFETAIGLSGGWVRTFTLPAETEVTLSFRYNLNVSSSYEGDEFGQALVSVNGVLYGTPPDDFVAQLFGEGPSTTGWQQFTVDLGALPTGDHTLILGGYNNQSNFFTEATEIFFDDLTITIQAGGTANPAGDGPDAEPDGICDAGDNCPNDPNPGQVDTDLDGAGDACDGDDDDDGVQDGADSHPLDPNRCRDLDGDGCDDCAGGFDDPANDGTDTDGDGLCNLGDGDDDNDGVADGNDGDPLDPLVCRDLDSDGCDDCALGTNDPATDGPDFDGDGLCDFGDDDDDDDGVDDGPDPAPMDPTICGDSDSDSCDDCDGSRSETLLEVHFDTDAESFTYIDDTFRGTSRPQNAAGTYLSSGGFSGGGVRVRLASNFIETAVGISGGWSRTFTLPASADVSLTFRYNLNVASAYEPDEYGQALVSVDGVLYGTPPDDFVAQLFGEGPSTTGWQEFTVDLGTLAAGDHTVIVGGYNNRSNSFSEETEVFFDDVVVTTSGGSGGFDPSQDGIDYDGDGLCNAGDPDNDDDGVPDVDDSSPFNRFVCRDVDGDGCNDCTSGTDDPNNDGVDSNSDGICDTPDPDQDMDGVLDGDDDDPTDPTVCRDVDGDGCDDCDSGSDNIFADGPDADGDGICDVGDADDDDDGVLDPDDSDDQNPTICRDADGDLCDDCASGSDDPSNDGTDTDLDGLCDQGDPDDDNDGVQDVDDSQDQDPTICRDADNDLCDDCTSGTDAPSNDGADFDGDGLCDLGDPDDDNDGVADGEDVAPFDSSLCRDVDGDGCDDCSGAGAGADPQNDGPDGDSDGICDLTDNCSLTPNPGQSDLDQDGAGNACDADDDGDGIDDQADCAPLDASAFKVPGPVGTLFLVHAGGLSGTTTLLWTPPAVDSGSGLVYDTVSTSISSDFVTAATCAETDDGSDTETEEMTVLAPGQLLFFEVRPENACGPGPTGADSSGTLRTVRACD